MSGPLTERERLAYTSNNALLLTSGSSWMGQENEATTSKRFPRAHSWNEPTAFWFDTQLDLGRATGTAQHSMAWHGMADASCRGIHARMAPLA